MALDPRLGRISASDPIRPAQTLSGQAFYADDAPPTFGFGDGWYCVLDVFAPPGFDVVAALDDLRALVPVSEKPAPKAKA